MRVSEGCSQVTTDVQGVQLDGASYARRRKLHQASEKKVEAFRTKKSRTKTKQLLRWTGDHLS
jgi:hypothetical protein